MSHRRADVVSLDKIRYNTTHTTCKTGRRDQDDKQEKCKDTDHKLHEYFKPHDVWCKKLGQNLVFEWQTHRISGENYFSQTTSQESHSSRVTVKKKKFVVKKSKEGLGKQNSHWFFLSFLHNSQAAFSSISHTNTQPLILWPENNIPWEQITAKIREIQKTTGILFRDKLKCNFSRYLVCFWDFISFSWEQKDTLCYQQS